MERIGEKVGPGRPGQFGSAGTGKPGRDPEIARAQLDIDATDEASIGAHNLAISREGPGRLSRHGPTRKMSSLLAEAQLATLLVGGHRVAETAGWSSQPKADRVNPIRARCLVGPVHSEAAG